MKTSLLFCISLLFMVIGARAQFTAVRVGVDGLTCSQCSRSVEMRLRKLAFVKGVQMDLEHTQGTLTVKPNAAISFDQVAKAITDAGFSVRFIEADYKPSVADLAASSCFVYKNTCYQLLSGVLPTAAATGKWTMRFIDKGLIDPVSYKRYQANQGTSAGCDCRKQKIYRFVM